MALRELVTRNFWWKFFSLLLAALTWVTINASLQRAQERAQSPVVISGTRFFTNIPLTLLTPPSSSRTFRVVPNLVNVQLSGKADDLQRLLPEQVLAFVDVTKIGDEKDVRQPIQIEAPGDFKTEVTPAYASVERITTTTNK